MVGSLAGSVVILDKDNHSIRVFTTSGLHVGTNTYTLEVWMAKYPMLKVTRGKFIDFVVEIDSICLHTSINSFEYSEIVYQLRDPPKIVSGILYSDVESLAGGLGNGYSLCGLRTFTSSNPTYFTVPASGNIISMAVKFPDEMPMYDYSVQPPANVRYPVSITVGLVEYP